MDPGDNDDDDYEADSDDHEARRSKRRARRTVARSNVKGPALSLIIVGGVGIANALVWLVLGAMTPDTKGDAIRKSESTAYQTGYLVGRSMGLCCVPVFGVCWGGFLAFSGYQMMNLRQYGLAKAGATVAMVPLNCCFLVGLPFGIWTLIVLNNPEVKRAFK
jgi:hypothetical protein